MEHKLGDASNYIIISIGICLIIFGVSVPQDIIILNFTAENIKIILVSVGASMLATALVSMVTARYLLKTEKTKEIIKEWGLLGLYETKAINMNPIANEALEKSSQKIDIITIGMTNYIANKNSVLINRIRSGVSVRIISCYPKTVFIEQRKKDEDPSGCCEEVGGISEEVHSLTRWINNVKTDYPQAKIEIKYLNTYPAFSYLRIDDTIFFGANLYLKPSQQNMAAGFSKNGKGYRLLTDYFDELWKNNKLLFSSISEKS